MLETIVINITEEIETVEVAVEEVLEEIFIEINQPGERKEFRQSWIAPYEYIGKAEKGSLETDAVWKIFRILINADGSVVITKAYPVKWIDALTTIYT